MNWAGLGCDVWGPPLRAGGACRWAGSGWRAAHCRVLVLASPPDLPQVRGGGGEFGFGLAGGPAAADELAQPLTVFEVAVNGFDGDAAAPVGRDTVGGGEAAAHLLDQLRFLSGRTALTGGGFDLASFPGRDQPVRAGCGQVVF